MSIALQDFVAALVNWWNNQPLLAPLSPQLYLGKAVPGQPIWNPPQASDPTGYYPYAVFKQIAGKTDGHNTGAGYWDDEWWEFACYHPDQDVASQNANLAIGLLDQLLYQPLVFQIGYQARFYRTGQRIEPLMGTGPYADLYVYRKSFTYRSTVGASRGPRP